MYSEQIRAHYANPRNTGSVANESCRAIGRSPVERRDEREGRAPREEHHEERGGHDDHRR